MEGASENTLLSDEVAIEPLEVDANIINQAVP